MSVGASAASPFPVLPINQTPCDGCTACRHRCTAGIPLTRAEYEAIRDHLAAMEPATRAAVPDGPQEQPWPGADDGATYSACRFLDLETGLCRVYPVRPLICRLFGHVAWLPCPIGAIQAEWAGGAETMRARADQEERTYEEWEGAAPESAASVTGLGNR